MITPIILTYNEEANIRSTLAALAWAPRVVILDSGSTDGTEEVARSFDNVSWFARKFDSHSSQWRHAIQETSVDTEYVLALDADMRPATDFPKEVQSFIAQNAFEGAWVNFDYCTLGRSLSSSIYPAQIRVFRKNAIKIEQPGHTQVFTVDGPLYRFKSRLIHDDRKPVERWLNNQFNYAALEASRIRSSDRLGLKDRLRRSGLSPLLWGIYAYVRAGGPIKLSASRAYAHERMIFESILSRLLAEKIDSEPKRNQISNI